MPGKLDEIREWYRVYKVAEGKKENTYAFDGECLPRVRYIRSLPLLRRTHRLPHAQETAIDVVGHSHFAWLKYSQLNPDKIQRLPGFQL